ncbi:SCND3 protein, partial [Atractosteus spatula]|nr:SCND3 protein [Atractosteus spatula]
MCGEKAAKQLNLLPPPKDTVTHRIIGMADDVKNTSLRACLMRTFLFCKPLPTGTTGEHIFQLLNEFIKENGINLIKCVGVCTDGTSVTTSRHSGVVARIREGTPDMKWTHCSIHRKAFAIKKMPDHLISVRLCCELYQGLTNEFTSALLD